MKDVVNLAKSRNKSIDFETEKKISQLEDAFIGLDGRSYNISIYIPFFEKTKSSRIINNKSSSNQSIFIFEGEDKSEQEYFEGYVLNEDGNYVSYGTLINEKLAEELSTTGRMLAVMGLEELYEGDVYGGGGGTSNNTSNPKKSFKMGNMTVKSNKESWIAGASELTIQMYKYENGELTKINYITGGTAGGNSENIFSKFSRREIRNQTQKYLNATLGGPIDTTPSIYNNSKFYFVIYEADNWPVPARHVPFTLPTGLSFNITFGSSDREYFNSNESNQKIPYTASNSEISFSPFLQ